MLFFLISFSILALIYSYIGWRLIVPAGFGFPWNALLWALLIVFLFMPFISIFLRVYGYKAFWSDVFAWITYLSFGFFSLVFALLVFRDMGLLVINGMKKSFDLVRSLIGTDPESLVPDNPGRHQFLLNVMNLGVVSIAGILEGYGIYEARRSPRIKRVTVPIPNLPADLYTFRMVQITDIHVSSTLKRDYVCTIVDKVNELEPDVIVFTGDLADGPVPDFRNDVAPLAELHAPHGVFFVTGNHEYYMGVETWIEEINRLGLTVLLNEHRILQYGESRILLAGVTDYSGGRFLKSHVSSPEKAIAGAPPSHVKILLAHQPRSIFAAASSGYDLLISGHTHGGQYFPWNYFVRLQQPYVSGLHRYEKTWIYVSRGTGYWGPPLRIGMPSEITVITFSRT